VPSERRAFRLAAAAELALRVLDTRLIARALEQAVELLDEHVRLGGVARGQRVVDLLDEGAHLGRELRIRLLDFGEQLGGCVQHGDLLLELLAEEALAQHVVAEGVHGVLDRAEIVAQLLVGGAQLGADGLAAVEEGEGEALDALGVRLHDLVDLGHAAGGAQEADLGGVRQVGGDGLDGAVDVVVRIGDVRLHDALLGLELALGKLGGGGRLAVTGDEQKRGEQAREGKPVAKGCVHGSIRQL